MSAANAVAGSCALVWVEGPDAQSFLQGLLTNDIAGLAAGASCHTLLLDNTGHIQADIRAVRTGEAEYTLVTDVAVGATLAMLLDTFHFSEDVDILGPETFACVSVVGQIQGEPAGVDMVVPGKVTGTIDLIGPDATTILTANDLLTGSPDLLEARRIADGVPRFLVDFTAANLVQEAGLEAAVSFDKGCYLGQETVARLHYRGRPNRRLCGVALDGPATAGASLILGERAVGVLTSVADDPDLGRIGLAILRREVAAGDQLQVDEGGTSATVVALPFTERS